MNYYYEVIRFLSFFYTASAVYYLIIISDMYA